MAIGSPAPTVAISSPASGASFQLPVNIAPAAVTSDFDGTIALAALATAVLAAGDLGERAVDVLELVELAILEARRQGERARAQRLFLELGIVASLFEPGALSLGAGDRLEQIALLP